MIELRPQDREHIRACRTWAEALEHHLEFSFFHSTETRTPPSEHVVVIPDGGKAVFVCVYEVQRTEDTKLGPVAHLAVTRRKGGLSSTPAQDVAVIITRLFGFADDHLATPGVHVLHFFAPLNVLTDR